MKTKGTHNYFVYIITNQFKSVLYVVGVTNNIDERLNQHYKNRGNKYSFAGRYNCYLLVYYEWFQHISHAIEREKEIKSYRRSKKERLIRSMNPKMKFLNSHFRQGE